MTDNPRLIGVPERLATDTLSIFHRNPRQGDIPAITDSLKAHGQFRPVVVNKGTHTGRPMEVLAGNHTVLAARELDGTEWALPELDAYVVDVDDAEADRIVLADNRTSDLGGYDDAVLLELLEGVSDDLEGTGWDDDDLAELLEGAATHSEALGEILGFAEEEDEDTDEDEEDADGVPDENVPHEEREFVIDPEDSLVAMNFSVTIEQRRRLKWALSAYRDQNSLDTLTDALIQITETHPDIDMAAILAEKGATTGAEVSGDIATESLEVQK